jgi:HEPN domain-containing protein
MQRHLDWLRQAENDLQWAEYSLQGGFYSQVCFIGQQSAEKALKGYCLFKGFDTIRTHSLYRIIKELKENGQMEACARELDIYYIAARYPDALPDGAPFEILTQGQAERALLSARTIFLLIKERMGLVRDDNR